MGKTLVFYGFKPHFGTFLKDLVLKILLLFVIYCWVSIWSCIFRVYVFIFMKISCSSLDNSAKMGSGSAGICKKSDEGNDESENQWMGTDQSWAREIPKLDYEVKSVSSTSTSKYQFYTGNSFCSVIEEPKNSSFSVQEMFVISNDESVDGQEFPEIHKHPKNDFSDVRCSGNEDFDYDSSENIDSFELNEEVVLRKGKTESSFCSLSFEEQEALSFTQLYFCEKEETINAEHEVLSKHELSDQAFSSLPNSDDFWAIIHKLDDFSGDSDSDKFGFDPINSSSKIWEFCEDSSSPLDDVAFDERSLHLVDVNGEAQYEGFNSQLFPLDPNDHHIASNTEQHTLSDMFSESDDSMFDDFNDVCTKEICDGENDPTDEVDVVLEQKEMIRQMKREMRRSKSGGLPIILEESESPRVEDDLRPLKFDEKIGRKDRMDEIRTIYKGYLDKMRKLDILRQQTMYAIGLLQLKNQDVFSSNRKISVPIIKSLLAHNFWSYKLRKHESDPVEKMIQDFQRDLEFVYISQLCLSWEILKWQHHKAEELQANDPDGFHQHNESAGEFQKFQVLLQRFTEDEPFRHGPRVQHYIKSRSDLPSLLQVPLIKDDPRSEWRGKGEDAVSIQMLKEVIWASMCGFWEFLHADKDVMHERNLMGIHGVQFDIQDPADTELLTEIHSNLQKKEKKLKELGRRSGNRIVKKFQKQQEQRPSHEMVIAEVELRLIRKVLRIPMQRLTTEQLLWCHKKVSKINVIGRKVHLETSFLLFPC